MNRQHMLALWVVIACGLTGCYQDHTALERACSEGGVCQSGYACVEYPSAGPGLWCVNSEQLTYIPDTAGREDAFDRDAATITNDIDAANTEFQRFYFLKVTDNSADTSSINPGADIDAVRLTKMTGVSFFVANVLDYKPKAGVDISAESSLTDNVRGEPTAFAAEGEDFNTANATSKCSLDDQHYLGLGGLGGYVIVDFGNNDIANGDVVTVYEIGNCTGNSGSAGYADAVTVEISVGRTIDESWLTVLAFQAGPVMSGIVAGLPLIPIP